ncbi:ankyrin repeat domain-containing protein 2 isoform X2 [Hippoglossus hippoglossus]|uniref:ankyrin repeat domain-containing protein 2 isoform X2 n=1 Tax=Hippoglossus hippoglossus TaxID=8267 RepID=UPI00148B35B0|nr:ankyrin repeat domain-containing protein 2 isoform X2 [Hippoglossus hippoglossus]
MMDHKTEVETKIPAEERVRRVSSDQRCEILELSGGENVRELCEEKKMIKKKTDSPRLSAEIPVIGHVDTAEFMNAATQGKLNVIDKYLADGGDPNVHDELKRTGLHRAALEGHATVVNSLLERGADINFKDQLGSGAIHWACRGGSLEVVEILKGHGADLNMGDKEGDTALHDAVRLNRYTIVKLLVDAGADARIKNLEGVTALQQVKQWQSDIMETLQRLETLREVGQMPPETPQERRE